MTLLHLRILDASSDTPRSTCVHPLERRLANGLKCLFLPRDYPATVVTPAINDEIVPASRPQAALSGS
jgi:hypothetical protein